MFKAIALPAHSMIRDAAAYAQTEDGDTIIKLCHERLEYARQVFIAEADDAPSATNGNLIHATRIDLAREYDPEVADTIADAFAVTAAYSTAQDVPLSTAFAAVLWQERQVSELYARLKVDPLDAIKAENAAQPNRAERRRMKRRRASNDHGQSSRPDLN